MGKAQEFGAYANIVASGFKTAAYSKSYQNRGQYSGGMQSDGNYYDPLNPGTTE